MKLPRPFRCQRPAPRVLGAALLALLLGALHLGLSAAEITAGWRVYKAADKLADTFASSVTVSPRTNVWVRHGGESERISRLDGFSIRTIPSPGEGTYPIYESRSGQLWSVYPEGLMLYQIDRWVEHPVAEIRTVVQADPLRRIRSIPLAPAEVDHVLFLLPDRLLEYSTETRQVSTLIRASQTALVRFNEMIEGADGNLWITGQRGVGRVEGPLRQIRAGAKWRDWPAPEPYQNFQRVLEGDDGGLAMVAESVAKGEKIVGLFRAGNWDFQNAPSAKVRAVWQGYGGGLWAVSRDSLWRKTGSEWTAVERGDALPTTFNEVAVSSGGSFWLATPDGLLRYAPPLWQKPMEGPGSDLQSSIVLPDGRGTVWFVGGDRVYRLEGSTWREYPWAGRNEFTANDLRAAWLNPGNQMLISHAGNMWSFSPATGQFTRWDPGIGSDPGAELKILGTLKSGAVIFQRLRRISGEHSLELFNTDGTTTSSWIQINPSWGIGEEITSLLETETSEIWLGGSGVIVQWRDNEAQAFTRKQGFLPVRAQCLIESGPGRIWCGGGDIIQEFDGRSWSLVRSGFERVQNIRKIRDGSIMVATTSGAHRYRDGSWVANTVEEGLPSPSVTDFAEDSRGRLWAVTLRGIAQYHPGVDVDPPRSTLVPLRGNRSSGGSESLTFQVRGMDRWKSTIPERLLYSRRLDGGAWGPFVPENMLNLNNLSSGTHTLEVRAMDRGWNVERGGSTLEFNVVIPWHQDPRLLSFSMAGIIVALFFAALAVNRHLRLVRSYAEVERIVAERTAQLERANQELLHSQKMKALGTLAAGVAHDFNNILSVIKGSAQVIEENVSDPERILARTSRIRTVVDQGATLVRSMLGMGRGAAETAAPCSVQHLLEETVKSLGEPFTSSASVEMEVPAGLPDILAVRNLLVQVIHNLLANGADAMGGKGTMHILCRESSVAPDGMVLPPAPSGSYVRIEVQDAGGGIAPEILPRIFEPFFTTKAFSKRRGTGLGLSMVYEMAKGMGIGLAVQSKLDAGTTFILVVPAVSPASTSAAARPDPV